MITDPDKAPIDIKELPKTLPKFSTADLLKAMPAHLKDPTCYMKIQKALLETLAGKHSHSDVLVWRECKDCMQKAHDHRLMMESLGFANIAMYMTWKKIHEQIRKDKKKAFY